MATEQSENPPMSDSDDSLPLSELVPLKKKKGKKSPVKKRKQAVKRKSPKPSLPVPKKPVSAYALFFSDTQTAIKSQNPGTSFGEVSKIVSSMWDSLEPDAKDIYKKKAETDKKDFLKSIAQHKATRISKEGQPRSESLEDISPTTSLPDDQDEPNEEVQNLVEYDEPMPEEDIHNKSIIDLTKSEDTQEDEQTETIPAGADEGSILRGLMSGQSSTEGQSSTSQDIVVPLSDTNTGTALHKMAKTVVYTSMTQSETQQTATVLPPPGGVATAHTTSVTRKIVRNPDGTTRTIKMTRIPIQMSKEMLEGKKIIVRMNQGGKPQIITIGTNAQKQLLRTLPTNAAVLPTNEAPPEVSPATNEEAISTSDTNDTATDAPNERLPTPTAPTIVIPVTVRNQTRPKRILAGRKLALVKTPKMTSVLKTQPSATVVKEPPAAVKIMPEICRRDGCSNEAIDSPLWDREYCSNECVVEHCSDVFDAWVATRQQSG